MSQKSKSAWEVVFPTPPRKKPSRTLFRRVRIAVLLLVLLVAVAIQPPVFRQLLGAALRFTVWRGGDSIDFGGMSGGIFEPVVFRNVVWSRRAESGAVTRVEALRARARLAWSNIFPAPVNGWVRSAAEMARLDPIGKNGKWFQELDLDAVTAKVALPTGDAPGVPKSGFGAWLRTAFGRSGIRPGLVTVRNGDFILAHGSEYLRARDARFSFSETGPGTFFAGEVVWKSRAGGRVFPRVLGRTSLQDSKVTLAGLQLAPDVTVQTVTFSTGDPGSGKLELSADLSAFGGRIEAEAESVTRDGRWHFDTTGNFSNIDIAALAAFVSLGDAAGGVLKEGHFSFRGMPGDFTRAEATVRLEAGAFQWESRQWDSLVLGLSLFDGRLQIPELKLRQGKNLLTIKGSMALPLSGANWWERQFDLKVDADIRNLTELSALLLPEFKYAAGQLFVRGAVSGTGAGGGRPPEFEGQLIVNGNGLQWHTAPVDAVNAALLFHEREIQIISAHLLRGEDFLRGSGRISLGDGSYSGEWRLSAKDLAIYKSALSPALLPAPLGGGAEIAWSGKGGAAAHDGEFTARLNRFRLLGPQGTLPLDAACSGTYRPGELRLERLTVADNGTSLTADVGIAPGAVSFRGMQIRSRDRVCLKGDALLPLDLWQRWPDVALAHLLNDKVAGRLSIEANNLDLRQVSRLTGIDWPLAGFITGRVSGDGALGGAKLGGSVRLTRGAIPLNWSGGIVRDVDAEFSLDGAAVRLDKATGRHSRGDFTVIGRLDLQNPRALLLEAAGIGTNGSQPFQFTVKGPAAAPAIAADGASPFPASAPPPAQVAN